MLDQGFEITVLTIRLEHFLTLFKMYESPISFGFDSNYVCCNGESFHIEKMRDSPMSKLRMIIEGGLSQYFSLSEL